MKKITYPIENPYYINIIITRFNQSKNGSEWETAKFCNLIMGENSIIIEYPDEIALFHAALLLGKFI